MARKDASSNPLLIPATSSGKHSDAAPSVQLHPLVILTISDYITRRLSRQQHGAIVGAIIGQTSGRAVTLEHAYECKLAETTAGEVDINTDWFEERLEQYKDVHKAPALDLVAIFMLGSSAGPTETHARLLRQVQTFTATDGILLLLFQPDLVDELQGGRLPIGLYESIQEQDDGDGPQFRFRELGFEVETGEAEMIGVDFVAKGGGNATAVPRADPGASAASGSVSGSKERKTKGKGKATEKKDGEDMETNGVTSANSLTAEDEELISSLTAKANAIKMIDQRINLIRSYLINLPPSYLTSPTSPDLPPDITNHALLRSIQAMVSRLPLLAPPTFTPGSMTAVDPKAIPPDLDSASTKEKQDIRLTSLLASLTRSVADAQSLGVKFSVLQRERAGRDREVGLREHRMALGDNSEILSGESGGF